jgi:tetratricopeptide (TPR) repeat protein
MSNYNRDTFQRMYQIGGAELALRYAEIAASKSSSIANDFISLRFYNAGTNISPKSEHQFATRFSQSSAQYIYFQLDMSNPWKYFPYSYTITARYYKPDNSLMGEIKDRFETRPEWRTWYYQYGWGWEDAGHWNPGTYRVEVFIDNEYLVSETFTIFTEKMENQKDEKLPPQGLGFDGWMEQINQMFPATRVPDKKVPPDDLGKMRWMLAVDQRYMSAMVQSLPGKASLKGVQELREIADDYQALLDAPIPVKTPFYTRADLQSKLADTYGTMARACEALHDYEQARQHYGTTIKMLNALGKHSEVQRYQAYLEYLDYKQHGNVDKEINRLHQALTEVEEESLDHASLLIDLGEIHRQNGDEFEAEKLLLQAEKILDKLGGEPSGEAISTSFANSLLAISQDKHKGGSTEIENLMKINGLYRSLSVGLSKIYSEINPQKAGDYRAKAARRDSKATNDAFSQKMLDSLDDLFKSL